jgi:hypothetical protein
VACEAIEKFFFIIIFCSSAAYFMQLFILSKFRSKEIKKNLIKNEVILKGFHRQK